MATIPTDEKHPVDGVFSTFLRFYPTEDVFFKRLDIVNSPTAYHEKQKIERLIHNAITLLSYHGVAIPKNILDYITANPLNNDQVKYAYGAAWASAYIIDQFNIRGGFPRGGFTIPLGKKNQTG